MSATTGADYTGPPTATFHAQIPCWCGKSHPIELKHQPEPVTAVPPRPTTPDATAGDGLREALAGMLTTWVIGVAYENAWLCADALLPTVRRVAEQRAAEELLAAADSYEDEAEQPAINRLADEVYRPGDCLSSLWLRARAAALIATPNHGRNAT